MEKMDGIKTSSSKGRTTRVWLLTFLALLILFVCAGSIFLPAKTAYADTNIAASLFTVNSSSTKTIEENVGVRIDRKVGAGTDEVEAYKGYSAVINGVFSTADETKIEFAFPQDSTSVQAKYYLGYAFTFKIEDVSGEGAYLLVKYYDGLDGQSYGTRGKVAVIYVNENGEETYKSSSFDGRIANSEEELADMNTVCLPEIRDNRGAGKAPVLGHMNLVWDNDGVLSVKAPLYEGTSPKLPEATDSKVVAKLGEDTYGLPKLSFPNGYKISFSTNGYHSVRFTSVAGVSLMESVSNEPAWYTAASNITTILLSDTVEAVYPLNTKISFPTATYYTGSGKSGAAAGTLLQPNGLTRTVKETMNLTVAGTYTLTYEDTKSGATSNIGRKKAFTFKVSDAPFTNMKGLIETDAAVEQVKLDRYSGLKLTSSGAYSGKINGVFKSNEGSSVEFLMPKTSSATANDLNVTFIIEDAVDASKYFEITYYRASRLANGRTTAAVVKYVDKNGETQYRSCSNRYTSPFAIYTEMDPALSGFDLNATLPEVGQESLSGRFELVWEGDVLSVKAPVITDDKLASRHVYGTLAKFDGTTTVNAATNSYGLPKISFPNGYRIRFSSATSQTVVLTDVAGTALGKEFAPTEPAWYTRNNNIVLIELEEKVAEKYPSNYGVVIPSASYTFNGAVDTVEKIELKKDNGQYERISAGIQNFTEAGNYTIRYTAIEGGDGVGNVQEYSFTIVPQNEFSVSIQGGGTAYSSYPVNYPVKILDAKYVFIDDELIAVEKIEIKKGEEAYKPIKAGEKSFNEPAIYTLRYTAIDGALYANNVKEVSFEVKEQDAYPVAISGGGTEFNAYPVGYKFNVLGAKYSLVSDDLLPVEKIEVKKDNGNFEVITSGIIQFNEIGTYTLRYTAVDGADYVDNSKEFTFEIKAQEEYSLNVSIDGAYEESYPIYYTLNIFEATYTLLTDEVKAVERIEVSKNGGIFLTVSAGAISFEDVGSYVVRYTAVADAEYQGNVKTVSFDVVFGNIVESEDLRDLFVGDVDVSNYRVTLLQGGKVPSGTLDGILVGPSAGGGSDGYSAAIKGSFVSSTSSDTTIKLLFPNVETVDTTDFGITFKVEDVNDPNNYFEIVYYYLAESGNRVKTRIGVVHNGEFRTTKTKKKTISNILTSKAEAEGIISPNAALPDLKYDGREGSFTLAWENDVLVVRASVVDASGYNYGETWDSVVAKFDGTSAVSGTTAFGLPKLSFPNGYKISISSTSAQPVMLTNISGMNLCEDIHLDNAKATSIKLLQDSVTYPSTTSEVAVRDVSGLGAIVEYKMTVGTYTFTGTTIVYPDITSVNFKKAGTYTLTYSVPGVQDVSQQLKLVDTPPALSFAQGVWAEERYIVGGENQSALTISKKDIARVYDTIDGIIDVDSVKIFIKGPADANYSEYEGGVFAPDGVGVYSIKYVAVDSKGGEGYIVRTINVVDGARPVITLEGELPESVLLKQTISLPSGSATFKGEAVDLIRSVYCNDQEVEVVNNKLTFDKVGEYIISYFAVDSLGQETLLRFVFVVEADETSPVITIEEMPKYALVGSEVSIAAYKASDLVDGELPVSVKVMRGVEEVQVSNGKFKAETIGAYSIIFYSIDASGNATEKIVTVTAVNTLPDGEDFNGGGNEKPSGGCNGCSGCNGCNSSILGGFGAVAVLVALTLFVFFKRRKSEDKNNK